jgi:hypothetical protein
MKRWVFRHRFILGKVKNLTPTTPKPTFAAIGVHPDRGFFLEIRPNYWRDYQLSNSIADIDSIAVVAMVDEGDFNLSLIAAINRTRRVNYNHSPLSRHAATRADLTFVASGDFDRQSGAD